MSKLLIKNWEEDVQEFVMGDDDYIRLGEDGKHITVWRNRPESISIPIAGFSGWSWWIVVEDE